MHLGQAKIAATVSIGQLFAIESQLMQPIAIGVLPQLQPSRGVSTGVGLFAFTERSPLSFLQAFVKTAPEYSV
jgi:hypothetical protein